MSDSQKRQKNLLRVLIIIGGILMVALIGAVIYFYAIGDTKQTTTTTEVACGCYMIDPEIVNDCGDPKRAFIFNINKVQSDQTCSAVCDTNQLTENLLNSKTPVDSYKSCTVRSISDTRCENMTLKDGNGKVITGRITPNDEINVEATFDLSTYSNYIFKVNSETITPDKIDGNKISKKITDFGDSDSIEILATAVDGQGDSINSIICRRIVDIEKEGSTDVNRLQVATSKRTDNTTKLNKVTITVGTLQTEDVTVKFSFDKDIPDITATDGLTVEKSKGVITMESVDIYDKDNFKSNRDFSVLNDTYGDVEITAEVYVNTTKLGTASTSITLTEATDDTGKDDTQQDPNSDFTVTVESSESCVERVAGTNDTQITIKVTNRLETADTITSIKDKLPLGFTYVEGSTTINGEEVEDSGLVTVTPVGDTDEVVWEPSSAWSVNGGGTLTVVFETTADTQALTGDNKNEVIVNPEQIPTDPDNLRSSVDINVAQDCTEPTEEPDDTTTVPQTGIFDSTIGRITVGLIVIATGWMVYTRPEGTKLSQMIVNSSAYKDLELTKLRITNPKRYFEEKTLRKRSKES